MIQYIHGRRSRRDAVAQPEMVANMAPEEHASTRATLFGNMEADVLQNIMFRERGVKLLHDALFECTRDPGHPCDSPAHASTSATKRCTSSRTRRASATTSRAMHGSARTSSKTVRR